MAKKKIIWSRNAKKKLYYFLEFYIRRDKSKKYSIELYHKISKGVKLLIKHPESGKRSSFSSVNVLIIDSFIVCYEFCEERIIIHSIFNQPQSAE